jgi:threonyl-tRNA synthetase
MVDEFYSLFGLEYRIRLSTRPDSFMGAPEAWDAAEEALRAALEENGREYYVGEKEGAFYGPKIDVAIQDSLGRQWQCGTVQLDFQLPERFGLRYTGADGVQHTPIVIHRAIFGSLERFLGVVLEHLAGALPVWLSPVQAVVLPIAERHEPYAREVLERLRARGVRGEVTADQSLNYRVRGAEKQKVPYILVVGDREQEDGTATVRRHRVKEQRVLPVDAVAEEIRARIASRVLDVDVPREAPAFQAGGGGGTDQLPY